MHSPSPPPLTSGKCFHARGAGGLQGNDSWWWVGQGALSPSPSPDYPGACPLHLRSVAPRYSVNISFPLAHLCSTQSLGKMAPLAELMAASWVKYWESLEEGWVV